MTSPVEPHARLPSHYSRKGLFLVLCLLLAVAGYFVLHTLTTGANHPEPGPPRHGGASALPVAVARVIQADLPIHLDGLGTVTPLNSVTVKTRVEGELQRVWFSEGQRVKKGELLAEIDPRAYAAQLTQAEGQWARDQALLENAEVDWRRYQDLLGQDAIAAQQVTGQKALVRQYQAAVKMDQGQIAAIRLQLEYCRITSPLNGRVGLRRVDPGNLLRPADNDGLVVISQTQPISVVFSLPEDRVPQLLQGQKSLQKRKVTAYDRTGTQPLASGQLLAIDNQIDPATGTIRLRAVFPNQDENLFANQFVTVRLELEPLPAVNIIPLAAVQHGAQSDFVYLADRDGRVKIRPVQLGQRDGERVAVLTGLETGDAVVVEGNDRLKEGQDIRIVSNEPVTPEQPPYPAQPQEPPVSR